MSTTAKSAAGEGQEHSETFQSDSIAHLAPRLVQALYRGVFGRDADAEGLETYSRKLAENADLAEVLAVLLGSDEYRSKSIEAVSSDLVKAAYMAILRREPDPEGFRAHRSQLIKERDVKAFLAGLVESVEFQDNMRCRLAGDCPEPGGVQALPAPVAATQVANIPSIVFTHHKCATTWMMNILDRYCAASNKTLYSTRLTAC
jgi:hypothetical protein